MTESTATDDYSRATLFDPIARSYGRIASIAWPTVFRTLVTDVKEAQRHSMHILDAGTGSGYWINVLAGDRSRKRSVGLDISEQFLKVARARARNTDIEFIRGNITDLDFRDNTFDGIVCADVLDTLPNVVQPLSEFNRVLAPGGLLSLVVRGPHRQLSRLVEFLSRKHVKLEMAVNPVCAVPEPLRDRILYRYWVKEPVLPQIDHLARRADLQILRFKPTAFLAHVLMQKRWQQSS